MNYFIAYFFATKFTVISNSSSIALSPMLSKKDLEPYLISNLVLSIRMVDTATMISPFLLIAAGKVIALVIPLIVKFASMFALLADS